MFGIIGTILFFIGIVLALIDAGITKWVLLFMLSGVVFLMTQLVIEESKNKDDCESIDGEYVVVDEEWNGKYYVDVYGCVKK